VRTEEHLGNPPNRTNRYNIKQILLHPGFWLNFSSQSRAAVGKSGGHRYLREKPRRRIFYRPLKSISMKWARSISFFVPAILCDFTNRECGSSAVNSSPFHRPLLVAICDREAECLSLSFVGGQPMIFRATMVA